MQMWPESVQAKIALVAGIVTAFVLAVSMVVRADYFNLVTIAIFTLPLLVLMAYDIQCIVSGQCEVYSWIKTILFLLSVAIAFYVQALRAHVTHRESASTSVAPRRVVYVNEGESGDDLEARIEQSVKKSEKTVAKDAKKKGIAHNDVS